MRAARIESSLDTARPAIAPTPQAAPDPSAAIRVASDLDAGSGSPVHALQAQLAEALAPPPPLRLDPIRVGIWSLALLYTAAAWWGVFSLGSVLTHHLIGR